MHPIKLALPGCYYDSQIYAGLLYLWCEDGSLLTIDWNKLVERISTHAKDCLKFAAHCAFRKGSYLYDYEWQLFVEDSEMKNLLLARFEDLSKESITLTKEDIRRVTIRQQENPFRFPHADSLFYYNKLYVGGSNGLQVSQRGGSRHPIKEKPVTLWDGPVLSMAASHQSLALASGTEGLFESQLEVESISYFKERLRSSQPSASVRWLYPSIYSSSYEGGYLADFDFEENATSRDEQKHEQARSLREIIDVSRLFAPERSNHVDGYSWGSHDKICLATQNQIGVIRFHSTQTGNKEHLESLGKVQVEKKFTRDIVNADSAYFGYVIETAEGLLVLSSSLESFWLDGEPVNWRVFPDSKDYVNHLHIIYDDHICIFSFNHDYFIDQSIKKVGISY